MDTTFIDEKIEKLKGQGVSEDHIGGYLTSAFELAFIKTVSSDIAKVDEVKLGDFLENIKKSTTEESSKKMSNFFSLEEPISQKIFLLHFKEILAKA